LLAAQILAAQHTSELLGLPTEKTLWGGGVRGDALASVAVDVGPVAHARVLALGHGLLLVLTELPVASLLGVLVRLLCRAPPPIM
jgi:hypothetical protein